MRLSVASEVYAGQAHDRQELSWCEGCFSVLGLSVYWNWQYSTVASVAHSAAHKLNVSVPDLRHSSREAAR